LVGPGLIESTACRAREKSSLNHAYHFVRVSFRHPHRDFTTPSLYFRRSQQSREFRAHASDGQVLGVQHISHTQAFYTQAVVELIVCEWRDELRNARPQGFRRCPDSAVMNYRSHSRDRKSTRLNSSHVKISYAVFCLKKKTTKL